MKYINLVIFFLLISIVSFGQRITIKENQFIVNEKPFFLIGTNTPWDDWNDFGGMFRQDFWKKEFKRLKKSGINSTRIWISCDGAGQPFVNEKGIAQAPSAEFWKHLDFVMEIAKKYKIYVMPTIMSFDHFDTLKPNHKGWKELIMSRANILHYANTFVIPLVKRYEHNPYFFSIDICNEPEWIHENNNCQNIDWRHLQMFAGIISAEIHRIKSPVLVSIGSAAVKWSSPKYTNIWSDSNLQKVTGDSLSYMDYWQIHYYSWINKDFSNPFMESPKDYMLNNKPCVIGETPGNNAIYGFPITYTEIYLKPYELGYSGVYPWTSNGAGVGDFGNLDTFGKGALAFKKILKSKK